MSDKKYEIFRWFTQNLITFTPIFNFWAFIREFCTNLFGGYENYSGVQL